VVIQGRRLKLNNLDKVFYPAVGFTKGQVIDYYARVASAVLPHLRDRPLTLKRYPDGVEGPYFYEKRCPEHRPNWVQTAPIWSNDKGDTIQFCLANDLPTLIWAANLADLELHTSLSLAKEIKRPTMVVFDLDPGEPADIRDCCAVGTQLNGLLEQLRLKSFAKTSGSKGLQVYVPLNTPVTYEQTKSFSRAVAQVLERANPKGVVSNMKKSVRQGKVFVDWSQNDQHKTTVCVYSLRAKDRPMVSTPVDWDEVEHGARPKKGKNLAFDSAQTLERVERRGDLLAPVLKLKQRLPAVQL